MAKIGLVGPSYQERSLPFDAQRTVNLYPVLDQMGKEVSALYGTPGLLLFGMAGSGSGRGAFTSASGRAFEVSGSGLYEIFSDGTSTLLGTLLTSSGNVSIDENAIQLGICDGTYAYMFTYSSNVFAQVTDGDFPSSVGTITVIDGYFVVNQNSTGKFFISSVNDGTAWAALDFATAESSPDNLLRVFNAVGQLWLLGTKTIEIWTNTGASTFPFSRISGAKMEVGILAPHTAVAADNSIFWVGQDNIGLGIVYRAQGFSPQRISTSAIELLIQKASSPSTLRAYTYQQDGHTFYAITGGGMSSTLVYDISTQLWHERAYLQSDGTYSTHRASTVIYAFNKHLAIDKDNGNIYQLSQDFYDDNGSPIKRQRTFTHLSNEGKLFRVNKLQVDFENGPSMPQRWSSSVSVSSSLATDYVTGVDFFVSHIGLTRVDVLCNANTIVYKAGDIATFSGGTAFGGFTTGQLNSAHPILYSAGASAYSFDMPVAAGSSATVSDASVIKSTGNLRITSTAHGMSENDLIKISGAADTGGIVAAQINGQFYIRNVTANTFDIMTVGTASSAVTGGGGSTIAYQKAIYSDIAQAWLDVSEDGARTWSPEYGVNIGPVGSYKTRAIWRRLGTAAQMTFRLSISDPVKVAICGAYLE